MTERHRRVADSGMLGRLVIDSVLRPREAARRLFALGLSFEQLAQGAVLVACAGTVLVYAAGRLLPAPAGADFAQMASAPLLTAALSLVELAVLVALVTRVGRFFGGVGDMLGGFALVVWLNVVVLILLALVLLTALLVPPLAVLLALAILVWMLWAPAQFVAELHGFQNAVVVLAGMVLAMLVLFLALNLLFAVLGILPQEVS